MEFEFQQPVFIKLHFLAPTEKVLKLTMIFHDSTQKRFYSKDQNKVKFKNPGNFEVLSSDCEALETSAASLTSSASSASLASATSTALFTQSTF